MPPFSSRTCYTSVICLLFRKLVGSVVSLKKPIAAYVFLVGNQEKFGSKPEIYLTPTLFYQPFHFGLCGEVRKIVLNFHP